MTHGMWRAHAKLTTWATYVRVIQCANTRKWRDRCAVHTPVGCSRLPSAVNDLATRKNLAKCHFWAALWRNCTTGLSVQYVALSRAQMCLTLDDFWAPPRIVPLPPRCAGWRRRRMSSGGARKESVRVAPLQTHGEDGAILLMLRWSLNGVSSVHCVQMCWERSNNSFCI